MVGVIIILIKYITHIPHLVCKFKRSIIDLNKPSVNSILSFTIP